MCLWVVWDEAVSTYLPKEEESSKELLWGKKKRVEGPGLDE